MSHVVGRLAIVCWIVLHFFFPFGFGAVTFLNPGTLLVTARRAARLPGCITAPVGFSVYTPFCRGCAAIISFYSDSDRLPHVVLHRQWPLLALVAYRLLFPYEHSFGMLACFYF